MIFVFIKILDKFDKAKLMRNLQNSKKYKIKDSLLLKIDRLMSTFNKEAKVDIQKQNTLASFAKNKNSLNPMPNP